MPSETGPEPRQPFAIRLAIGLMAILAISGMLLIGNGLYILAKAEFAADSSIPAAQHHLADFRILDAAALERASEI